LLTDK